MSSSAATEPWTMGQTGGAGLSAFVGATTCGAGAVCGMAAARVAAGTASDAATCASGATVETTACGAAVGAATAAESASPPPLSTAGNRLNGDGGKTGNSRRKSAAAQRAHSSRRGRRWANRARKTAMTRISAPPDTLMARNVDMPFPPLRSFAYILPL